MASFSSSSSTSMSSYAIRKLARGPIRKRAAIWNFFSGAPHDDDSAICRLCGQTLSVNRTTNWNLHFHAQKHHRAEYERHIRRSSLPATAAGATSSPASAQPHHQLLTPLRRPPMMRFVSRPRPSLPPIVLPREQDQVLEEYTEEVPPLRVAPTAAAAAPSSSSSSLATRIVQRPRLVPTAAVPRLRDDLHHRPPYPVIAPPPPSIAPPALAPVTEDQSEEIDGFKITPISEATHFLFTYIVSSSLPLEHVYNPLLQRLMRAEFPDFQLPCQATLEQLYAAYVSGPLDDGDLDLEGGADEAVEPPPSAADIEAALRAVVGGGGEQSESSEPSGGGVADDQQETSAVERRVKIECEEPSEEGH